MKHFRGLVRQIGKHGSRSSLVVLLAALLLTGIFQGCSRKKLDSGKLEGSVYTNQFFNMQLTIPSGWAVMGEAGEKDLRQAGDQTVKSSNPFTEHGIKKSEERTVQLLGVSKGAWGVTPLNSSFICMAEQIPMLSPISRGSEYLAQMKKMFQYSSVPMRVAKDVYPVTIGGVEFAALGVATGGGLREVQQTYYAYVTQGHALAFIVTPFSDEDRDVLEGVIKSVTFKKS
jgi:hypothetical protein